MGEQRLRRPEIESDQLETIVPPTASSFSTRKARSIAGKTVSDLLVVGVQTCSSEADVQLEVQACSPLRPRTVVRPYCTLLLTLRLTALCIPPPLLYNACSFGSGRSPSVMSARPVLDASNPAIKQVSLMERADLLAPEPVHHRRPRRWPSGHQDERAQDDRVGVDVRGASFALFASVGKGEKDANLLLLFPLLS